MYYVFDIKRIDQSPSANQNGKPNMFDAPHQMHPMLPPDHAWRDLSGIVESVALESTALGASLPAETIAELRQLVRSMNSYYSNKIEGQGTHPANIERALRHDFSLRPPVAALQRLALAHIATETQLEEEFADVQAVLSSGFIQRAHEALYQRLPPPDRTTQDGRKITPGKLRVEDVTVGRHLAPSHSSLARFLLEFDRAYVRPWTLQQRLVAAACAHHRLSWIHPFLDGNGRAARLQSHVALLPLSRGLWSVNRGLARGGQRYYEALAAADTPRQGDLDGRGNLSQRGLLTWVRFFLETALEQVRFMSNLLALPGMRARLEGFLAMQLASKTKLRQELALPLHHLFAAGSLSRGEFVQMTGLGERTARYALADAVKMGIVKSSSPHGPLRFGLPLEALPFLLPNLYPEAATPNLEDAGAPSVASAPR